MHNKDKILVDTLIRAGYLKTPAYIEAFKKIKRKDFVLPKYLPDAYINRPLKIGYGQTISQPATVAFMIEHLKPVPGDNILDVGSGSGWQAALFGYIVGSAGRVTGIELIRGLVDFSKNNLKKYNMTWIDIVLGDGCMGYPPQAPFDKIIVAAAVQADIPTDLYDQLKIGGRMIIPLGGQRQSLVVVDKLSDSKFKNKEYPGFIFVPLIQKN